MRCVVPLMDRSAPRRILPVHDERSVATAQALDWPGVLLEAGRNDVAEVDDLTLSHHYLGMNAGARPLRVEMKEQHGFRNVTLAPGAGWFVPAGDSFSLRMPHASTHPYVRISIDRLRFDRLLANDDADAPSIALRRTYCVAGAQMRHVLSALVAEASGGTPSGLALVETLTTALGLLIVQHAGVAAPRPERSHGGLAPAVRRRVLELMDARPDARLTITELAREAGLSPAHFARAFKETVGRAPHQHMISLRLARARRLLEAPDAALSDVALRTGFADQAHFTRFFKREFGVTPGVLLRSRRRA